MSCCDADVQAEIAALEQDLAAVRAAIRAVLTNGHTYQLDTGQTRQLVTRANLDQLRDMRNALQNEIQLLKGQCDGGGATHVVPGW